jgi:hypothetical protein
MCAATNSGATDQGSALRPRHQHTKMPQGCRLTAKTRRGLASVRCQQAELRYRRLYSKVRQQFISYFVYCVGQRSPDASLS